MTVADLIVALERMRPDLPVVVGLNDPHRPFNGCVVRGVTVTAGVDAGLLDGAEGSTGRYFPARVAAVEGLGAEPVVELVVGPPQSD